MNPGEAYQVAPIEALGLPAQTAASPKWTRALMWNLCCEPDRGPGDVYCDAGLN
jgi:hypothetical protein